MNKIIIIGHLGKDPETRFTSSGEKVTTFSVATNKRRGEQNETIWYRVTIWGDRFDKMMTYLKKGSIVFVSGELGLNKWTDASGKEKTSLEVTADSIHFLPSSRSDGKEGQNGEEAGFGGRARPQKGNDSSFNGSYESAQTTVGRGSEALSDINEDPLPF